MEILTTGTLHPIPTVVYQFKLFIVQYVRNFSAQPVGDRVKIISNFRHFQGWKSQLMANLNGK